MARADSNMKECEGQFPWLRPDLNPKWPQYTENVLYKATNIIITSCSVSSPWTVLILGFEVGD